MMGSVCPSSLKRHPERERLHPGAPAGLPHRNGGSERHPEGSPSWGEDCKKTRRCPPRVAGVRPESARVREEWGVVPVSAELINPTPHLMRGSGHASFLGSLRRLEAAHGIGAIRDRCSEALHGCNEALHRCNGALHLCNEAVHLLNGALHHCNGALHPCRETLHHFNGALQLCNAPLHRCRGALKACNATLQRCNGALKRYNGTLHECSQALQRCNGTLHCCKGALHRFRCALHTCTTNAHRCGGSEHRFNGALYRSDSLAFCCRHVRHPCRLDGLSRQTVWQTGRSVEAPHPPGISPPMGRGEASGAPRPGCLLYAAKRPTLQGEINPSLSVGVS